MIDIWYNAHSTLFTGSLQCWYGVSSSFTIASHSYTKLTGFTFPFENDNRSVITYFHQVDCSTRWIIPYTIFCHHMLFGESDTLKITLYMTCVYVTISCRTWLSVALKSSVRWWPSWMGVLFLTILPETWRGPTMKHKRYHHGIALKLWWSKCTAIYLTYSLLVH